MRIPALTPARLLRGPPACSGLSSRGAAQGPRRAGCQPGQGAPCSLPAKCWPASLCSDASRNRELPLSPSRPALPSPPLLSASASAARAQPPRPLCPQLCAGSRLPLRPLLPVRNSEPPANRGVSFGLPVPVPAAAVCLHLSRAPLPRRLGAGTEPFALLFCGEPRGGRGSPLPVQPLSSRCQAAPEPSQFFIAPLPVARENTLCRAAAFSAGTPAALASAGVRQGLPRGWGAAEPGRPADSRGPAARPGRFPLLF